MATGYKIARGIFIFANICFFLMGAVIFGIGIYVQISQNNYINLTDNSNVFSAVALMVAAGIIVFIVSFIGLCGAWMENQCMLCLYFVCVLIIFAMELAAGILGYIYFGTIEAKVETELLEGLSDFNRRGSWDIVQEEAECCGVRNYTDWYGIADSTNPTVVPDSCCGFPTCGQSGGGNAYKVGCLDDAKNWITDNILMVGAAGIILAVLQILMMIIAIVLVVCLRREKLV